MLKPLEFSPSVETVVRFIEDTAPEHIVEATAERLAEGTPAIDLLRAAALAVTRSTELPPDHHGGPVHPVAGIHAVHQLSRRLTAGWSNVPVIQSVALANRHIHSPEMGPALLPALAADDSVSPDPTIAREQFHRLIVERRPVAAERYMIGLLKADRVGDVLAPMLEVAIPRNSLDDHYLLYLVHTVRGLDDVGWEWAGTLLRPPLRYLATNPLMDAVGEFGAEYMGENVKEYQAFDHIESLLERHNLLDGALRIESVDDEATAIGALGEHLGDLVDHRVMSEALASAMASGLSLKGAGEALSYAAGLLYLRTTTGNPFDVHMHTGLNPRRYLLNRDDLPVRIRILLLLSWPHGPEVRNLFPRMNPQQSLSDVEVGENVGQGGLLEAIRSSIETQPELDLDSLSVPIDDVVAAPEVDEVMKLAYAYARRGYDAEPVFELFAKLVSQEDVTEMHAYKLQEATREEYYATREPFRWVHLVSAARHLATVYTLRPVQVFPRIARSLDLPVGA